MAARLPRDEFAPRAGHAARAWTDAAPRDVAPLSRGPEQVGLTAAHPELRKHLYTDEGKLRAFVNLYVNDEDIRYLQKEATTLKDGDNISIVPSIAGGAA